MTETNLRAVVPERVKRLAFMRQNQLGFRSIGDYLEQLILQDAKELNDLVPNGNDAA